MEPLKNMYHAAFLAAIGKALATVVPGADEQQFVTRTMAGNWHSLELKQRITRIAEVIHSFLSGQFQNDVHSLLQLKELMHTVAGRDNTFEHIYLAEYIALYGQHHPELAFMAMEQVTILSSCEFAIRPFIIANPIFAIARMQQWATHAHPSVRRLASEGCRPRLPWGMAIASFKKDPAPILPIITQLRNDDAEYVRKSVANNLNDISKDNPDIVLKLANDWKGQSKNTDWILKHACRTLLKKGDETALNLFGVANNVSCTVHQLSLGSEVVPIGGVLSFSCTLSHPYPQSKLLRVEYAITYQKTRDTGRKIFKLSEKEILPNTMQTFKRSQSFADMTTRKHFPGVHTLEIVVNGVVRATTTFQVVG